MAKRPSLADSLMASLNKGVHVETAERIARGLPTITDDPTTSVSIAPVTVAPVIVDVQDAAPVVVGFTPAPITTPIKHFTPLIKSDKNKEQSSGQSKGQTNGQANERANGPSNDLTGRQTVYLSNERANDGTVELSNEPTNDQPNGQAMPVAIEQAVERTVGLPQEQTDRRTDEQSVERLNEQTIKRSIEQSSGRSAGQPNRTMWAPLTEYQGRVLVYLYEVAGGLTNVDTICSDTVIAYGTVRKCIDVLVKEGYIIFKQRFNGHAFNGFEYAMDNHLCSIYLARVRGGQSDGQPLGRSIGQSIGLSAGRTNGLTNERAVPFSSSRFLEDLKPTTTQAVVEGNVLTGAVGAYWEEEGLGEAQAKKWCSQFEVDPEQMRIQLDWARFDLETNNRRETVTKDTISWFFGHLRTTGGCFPRPVNYRSSLEIRAEALQQQQERDKKAKALIEANEVENKFQAFLSDPDSPLFDELFDQISSFAKEQYKDGQKMVAEIELREIFRAHCQQNRTH